jgi:methylase of polypeptide subunit release factors
LGRRPKIVPTDEGHDRREVGYYSTPQFVAEFLASRLLVLRPDAKRVLDPCVGQGELTAPFARRGLAVVGYDIVNRNPSSCDNFTETDFLEVAADTITSPLFAKKRGDNADVVVANPPYNCHETEYIRRNKETLIDRYGKSTALNMYSLFLRAIIDYADEGALIGLVTHDSFLTAVGHRELRRSIIEDCTIFDLHLCPTSLFRDQNADVRTCLMILEKSKRRTYKVLVSNRDATVQEFKTKLINKTFDSVDIDQVVLTDARDNMELIIGVPKEIVKLFSGKRIADLAPCITGISTGNDSKYISKDEVQGFRVPFYKNPASRKYFAEADGYMCDDYNEVGAKVPNFLIRNKELLLKGGL